MVVPSSPLNLNSIFPMKDEASARLMMLKADCLRAAGLIDDAERQTIVTRAISILAACCTTRRVAYSQASGPARPPGREPPCPA